MSAVSGWCLPRHGADDCFNHEECERRGCVCDCPRHGLVTEDE